METSSPAPTVVSARIGQRIGRAYAGLSVSQRRAADFLLGKPFDVATMTIEEFAAAADISTASANRFARALGFSRYAEFRTEIVEAIRPALPQEEKLRAARGNASSARIIAESLAEDGANIRRTQAALSAGQAQAAVEMLLGARRIFTVGFGTSSYLASYAANVLDLLCPDARFAAVEGGTEQAARRLVKLGAKDVVLAITFPRYSKDIVATVRVAKARGARVLAITDSPTSPVASLSDLAVYAFAERQILSSSAVAALALIEALAGAVACRRKGAIAAMRALTKQVKPYLEQDEATERPAGKRKGHNRRT